MKTLKIRRPAFLAVSIAAGAAVATSDRSAARWTDARSITETSALCCATVAVQPPETAGQPAAPPAPAGAASDAQPSEAQPIPAPPIDPSAPAAVIRGRVSITGGMDLQKPDLTRVVVYLSSPTVQADPAAEPLRAEVAQRNKAFVPNFIVVPQGTTVEFPNWDDFDHNVFSRSKAAPAFDLDRYPYGQSKSRVFDKVGVVQVFCNVHPKMRAIVFVTPSALATRCDADGAFELCGVPPGRHEVTAWHERCGEVMQTVEAGPGAESELIFALEASRKTILDSEASTRRPGYGIERGLGVKREKLDLPVVKESHPAPPDSK